MDRILEPEVMENPEQALAYAQADFRDSNGRFIEGLVATLGPAAIGPGSHILDLGCGPGAIPVELAQKLPQTVITAIDASAAMLDLAQSCVTAAGVADRVRLHQAYLPHWPTATTSFTPPLTAVISKDMLHHLPDPQVFWQVVRTLAAQAKAPLPVYVMDLLRPPSAAVAQEMVQGVAGSESLLLQQDFHNSLCASFTLEEVQQQLDQAQLSLSLTRVGDRHFLVQGSLPIPSNFP
ncbi:MAG: methyltransferase domain-containing protein [Prochlorothrix sp.]|nr:methyltransferase domain-containing protein [Prochlorothrix sp.]